jgi:hypothetical protein
MDDHWVLQLATAFSWWKKDRMPNSLTLPRLPAEKGYQKVTAVAPGLAGVG